MPQKPSLEIMESSSMGTFLKTILFIAVAIAAFFGGYFTANKGYRVVDSDGTAMVKSNAAATVKDENARLGRSVINATEAEAETLLKNANRTMFVGVRDGAAVEYKGQKTFTNLTVEVKDGRVVRVLGWY